MKKIFYELQTFESKMVETDEEDLFGGKKLTMENTELWKRVCEDYNEKRFNELKKFVDVRNLQIVDC